MINQLVAKSEIEINADIARVWNALIDPELIKQYLFGTEAVSEWKVGSTISFKGKWEDRDYEDKGIILILEENKTFQYAYWTSFSGLEDKRENYVNITYELSAEGQSTILSVTQDNIDTEEMIDGISDNWKLILNEIKKIIEESSND